MAAASGAFNSFLPESLTNDNYERWSVLMRNYLMGHDLWDVVSGPNFVGNWKKNNAMALYVIQFSCGSDAFRLVQKCGTAKDAWNQLSTLFSPCVEEYEDIEQGILDGEEEGENFDGIFDDIFRANSNIRELYEHLKSGKWDAAKSYIANDPTVVSTVDSSGRSILHIAVIAGDEEIVKKLIDLVEDIENLLKIKDNYGYTTLALAATLPDNPMMAKCMVEKCKDLLTMESNKADEIPVLLASDNCNKVMTRYLYTQTPWGAFPEGQVDHYMRVLFIQCIKNQIFDVALAVLRRCPGLLLTHQSQDLRPLFALAQKHAVFRSGCQLKNRWQMIFYKILNVERDNRKRLVADNEKGGQNTSTGENVLPHISIHEQGHFDIEAQADPNEGQGENTGTGKQLRSDWLLDKNLLFVLGKLLLPVWVLVQNLILLKFCGIKELYETKLNHDLLDEILEEMTKRISKSNNSELKNASAYDAILVAATHGITELVCSIREAKPELLIQSIHNSGIVTDSIRDGRIDLLEEMCKSPDGKMLISNHKDEFRNNVLHLAAESGPAFLLNRNSCPVLKMLRELKLFKKVERMLLPKCKKDKNAFGKTPRKVFSESHEEMAKAAEKWAKDSASSFSLVGTLIVTIMFAAVFTVPGGFNQETGIPILLNRRWFKVFMIADAMSLFLSITSVLIFIRVLSSNHKETDFLESLSSHLKVGMNILFLAVVSMTVAFYAALTLMLKGETDILITVAAFAFITLCVFVKTLFPLYFDFGDPSI